MKRGTALRWCAVALATVGCGLPLAACGRAADHAMPASPSAMSTASATRSPAVAPSPAATNTPTSTPAAAAPTATATPATPAWTIEAVSPARRQAMLVSGSWRAGCPVAIDDLRVLTVRYHGFDGATHTGELMVNADVAPDVLQAFRSLFNAGFPVRRVELVDNFSADDEQSMLADNTSAYNCRLVPGTNTWSQHAYGRAVDLNPFENPEVQDGAVDPPGAAKYADRSFSDIGMIAPGDPAVRAFQAIGWHWGGDWTAPKDYQHFSLTGN